MLLSLWRYQISRKAPRPHLMSFFTPLIMAFPHFAFSQGYAIHHTDNHSYFGYRRLRPQFLSPPGSQIPICSALGLMKKHHLAQHDVRQVGTGLATKCAYRRSQDPKEDHTLGLDTFPKDRLQDSRSRCTQICKCKRAESVESFALQRQEAGLPKEDSQYGNLSLRSAMR
jgi:hypothetical protein